MECSYCDLPAQVKCPCIRPYMCRVHLGEHLVSLEDHKYELIDRELTNQSLAKLRKEVLDKLGKLVKVKNDVTLKTNKLIKLIELSCKQSLTKLDAEAQFYLKIFKANKFCESDLKAVKKVEMMALKVKPFSFNEIQDQIKMIYSQEFIEYLENLEDGRKKFLNKHVAGFRCGVLMKDEKTLVTGGSDSVVRVWDSDRKKQLFALHGHNSVVQCISLTTDCQHIITGSYDTSVRIWSFQQMTQVSILKIHKSQVNVVSYIEKSSSIVSGEIAGGLIIWDFYKGSILKKIKTQTVARSLIFTMNQDFLIAGLNPDIVFYEIESCVEVKTLKGHTSDVLSMLMVSDKNKMVSGSADKTIIIWDLLTYNWIMQVPGHTGVIHSLAMTLDNQFFVSGSSDETMKIWNLDTGAIITEIKHESAVWSIVRAKDRFLSLTEDSKMGELNVFDSRFNKKTLMKPFKSISMLIKAGPGIVAYGSNNKVCIWEMETKKEKNVLIGHKGKVGFVDLSSDRQFAISCCEDSQNNLIYWNLQTNEKVMELIGHTRSVFCACFSKNGLTAASGSADKTIRTWDLTVGKQIFELQGNTGNPYSIKFLDTRKLLVSGGDDLKLILWDLKNGTLYKTLYGHNYTICKVLETDNEKFIISGDFFEGIRIWNLEKMECELTLVYQDLAVSWLTKNKIELELVREFLRPLS